ncbi:MAG: ABC transporter substrate-binding protein [bacterium]|nr:ABC transporter substrate-binding protein [bacterium]
MSSLFINKIRRIFSKVKTTLMDFFYRFKEYLVRLKLKNSLVKGSKSQINLDKKLVYSLTKTMWPNFNQFKYIGRYLTSKERLIINCCLLVILVNFIFLGTKFYIEHCKNSPVSGGTYIEGLIGAPKYINPLYSSVSDTDSDITFLVFSSLFKRDKNGKLVNDLVENYEANADGKSYTIKIRPGVKWHDNSSLTVNDIIFTFNTIKDIQYKSPLRSSFIGVELEEVDDNTIKFILSEPYAAFLDLLTFGILPESSWQQIAPGAVSLASLNLKPIGSGPYKFKSLIKDTTGNIRSYTLVKNDNYYRQSLFIDKIIFKFFADFPELISTFNDNLINGISYLPVQYKSEVVAKDSFNSFQLRLPQLTAVFFNSKTNLALSDKKVRQALAFALDKNKIIAAVNEQNALVIDGPILPESFAYSSDVKKYYYNVASTTMLLDEAGWKKVKISQEEINQANLEINSADEVIKKKAEEKISMGVGEWRIKDGNYLIVELTTVNTLEYTKVAEEISKFWQLANVKTIVNLVSSNKIQSEIIGQRSFSALLYSELVGADPDPYAFWHSSQIGQSGLNISDYANKEVDKLLEDARLINDVNARREKYVKFQEIISEDVPAIFLYSPSYTYVQSKQIKGFAVKNILMPYDRFANIDEWYIKTGKKIVW